MDRAKTRITVAGAGAFGRTVALSLARAGFQVSVFDPCSVNASSVAAGMLAPVFESLLDSEGGEHFSMLMTARDLWPALAEQAGIVLDRRGAVAVGDPAFLEKVFQGLGKLGLSQQEMSRADLSTAAPGLGTAFRVGVQTSEDWRLEPVQALAALRDAGEAAGVTFIQRSALGMEGGDRLVIATGAGQDLTPIAPLLKVLTPIKGQILRSKAEGFDGVLRFAEGYCVGGAGELAVGATMEPGHRDLQPTAEARARLEGLAAKAFPGQDFAFKAQVGVRATTPDGLPMIGATSDPNVLLAVGARRNGWLLAPLAGQIITSCLTEGEPGPYAACLAPKRVA